MENQFVLGVDIGGTNLRLALIDTDFKVHNPRFFRVADIAESNFLQHFMTIIEDYLGERSGLHLLAIGVGVPGIVSHEGRIFSCPNITVLEKTDLKKELQSRFQVPVWVDKDVNLTMFGEYKLLGRPDLLNVVGFYIGTGFGCSMILGGEILRGTRGFAGELGHIPLKGKHDACNCGSSGCLEMYAAGKMITELASELRVPVADFFVEAAGKPQVEDLIENMALGMTTVINLLDPQMVILGGGVVEMARFPMSRLMSEVRSRMRSPLLREEIEFVPSQAGIYGGCLGAGVYCYEYLLQDPAKRKGA